MNYKYEKKIFCKRITDPEIFNVACHECSAKSEVKHRWHDKIAFYQHSVSLPCAKRALKLLCSEWVCRCFCLKEHLQGMLRFQTLQVMIFSPLFWVLPLTVFRCVILLALCFFFFFCISPQWNMVRLSRICLADWPVTIRQQFHQWICLIKLSKVKKILGEPCRKGREICYSFSCYS